MDYHLDHLVEVTNDLEEARTRTEARFGRKANWKSSQADYETLEWRTENGGIEILSPTGGAPPGALGLKSLVLVSKNLERAREALQRTGLEPSAIDSAQGTDQVTGARRAWKRLRCPDVHLGGLKLFVLEREEPLAWIEGPRLEAVEFVTGDATGLVRLLGASLGLARTEECAFDLGGVRLEILEGPPGSPHRIEGYRLARPGSSRNADENRVPEVG